MKKKKTKFRKYHFFFFKKKTPTLRHLEIHTPTLRHLENFFTPNLMKLIGQPFRRRTEVNTYVYNNV